MKNIQPARPRIAINGQFGTLRTIVCEGVKKPWENHSLLMPLFLGSARTETENLVNRKSQDHQSHCERAAAPEGEQRRCRCATLNVRGPWMSLAEFSKNLDRSRVCFSDIQQRWQHEIPEHVASLLVQGLQGKTVADRVRATPQVTFLFKVFNRLTKDSQDNPCGNTSHKIRDEWDGHYNTCDPDSYSGCHACLSFSSGASIGGGTITGLRIFSKRRANSAALYLFTVATVHGKIIARLARPTGPMIITIEIAVKAPISHITVAYTRTTSGSPFGRFDIAARRVALFFGHCASAALAIERYPRPKENTVGSSDWNSKNIAPAFCSVTPWRCRV